MLDAVIPGCEREIYQIIGRGVGEDATQKAAITDNRDFNVAVVRCEPGKGTLHHDHETNEGLHAAQGPLEDFLGERRGYPLRHPRPLGRGLVPTPRDAGLPQRERRGRACSS